MYHRDILLRFRLQIYTFYFTRQTKTQLFCVKHAKKAVFLSFFPPHSAAQSDFYCEGIDFRRADIDFRREEPEFSREKPEFNREEPEFNREKPEFNREEPEFNREEIEI